MENSFKKLEPEVELPPHIKQQTLGNLDTVKMILNVIDLFLVKAGSTIGASLSVNPRQPLPPKEESTEL